MKQTARIESLSEVIIMKVFFIIGFTFLTAASAFVKIPMYPVPITLQTLFVLLAANILGKKAGTTSQLLYLSVGFAGVPIFANGGGPAYVFQPSFGYLIGFVPAAYFTGVLVEKIDYTNYRKAFFKLFMSNLVGMAVIYAFGISYLYFSLNFLTQTSISVNAVIFSGLIIFIPGMITKLLAASFMTIWFKKFSH